MSEEEEGIAGLVKRLRRFPITYATLQEAASTLSQQAGEIERLRAEFVAEWRTREAELVASQADARKHLDRLESENAALQARLTELEEALSPFAMTSFPDAWPDDHSGATGLVNVGEFRKARSVLLDVRDGPQTEAASPAVAISESDQAQRSELDQSLPGPDQQSAPYAVAVATPMSQTATPSMVERVRAALQQQRQLFLLGADAEANRHRLAAGNASMWDALARAAIEAMREPTEAMLNGARDWSVSKYGIGIGNDAAIGCWRAMITAALSEQAQP